MADDRLISLNAAIDALEKEKPTPFVNKDGSIDPFGVGRQNQWYRDGIAIMNLPYAQPTMYGYDIKTLAFVAGIMAQEGVTPEEAVAIFRDIQKCVDYIWSDVHKTIQKSMDDVMNHDCNTCLHSDRMPHIYPCDKCSTGHERWESKT